MRRKLYIINNGMKDLRGHYFETSVSIAEASKSLGLHAVLAAHVNCPSDIVPDGLEFHAAFTTDHWMAEPPPPQPDLGGLRCDPNLLASNTIEELIAGRIGFKEYLEARFHPEDGLTHGFATRLDRATPAALSGRARMKRLAKAVVPPVFLSSRPLFKRMLRQLVPPFAWNRLKAVVGRRRHSEAQGAPPPSNRSEFLLTKIGTPQEYDYSIRFQQDLERLLLPDRLHGRGPCLSADGARTRAVRDPGIAVSMAR